MTDNDGHLIISTKIVSFSVIGRDLSDMKFSRIAVSFTAAGMMLEFKYF